MLKSDSPNTLETKGEKDCRRTGNIELWWYVPSRGLNVVSLHISSVQKVADDKGVKAKKGGVKGKKDDGPAQNGETKTSEVWGG